MYVCFFLLCTPEKKCKETGEKEKFSPEPAREKKFTFLHFFAYFLFSLKHFAVFSCENKFFEFMTAVQLHSMTFLFASLSFSEHLP
jgi:hypothetical protein